MKLFPWFSIIIISYILTRFLHNFINFFQILILLMLWFNWWYWFLFIPSFGIIIIFKRFSIWFIVRLTSFHLNMISSSFWCFLFLHFSMNRNNLFGFLRFLLFYVYNLWCFIRFSLYLVLNFKFIFRFTVFHTSLLWRGLFNLFWSFFLIFIYLLVLSFSSLFLFLVWYFW